MIYTLSENNIPFYIGISDDLDDRLRRHRNNFGKERNLTIEKLDDSDDEEFWIQQFQVWGFTLVNQRMTLGGQKFSEAHKRKLADRKTGVKRSIESRRIQSKAQMGHITSKETRKKISESQKGIKRGPMSEQHKLNISKSMRKGGNHG